MRKKIHRLRRAARVLVLFDGDWEFSSGLIQTLGMRGKSTGNWEVVPIPGPNIPRSSTRPLDADFVLGAFVGPEDFAGLNPSTRVIHIATLSKLEGMDCVFPAAESAGQKAAKHLKEQGCVSLLLVGAPGQFVTGAWRKGFFDQAQMHGIPAFFEPSAHPSKIRERLISMRQPMGILCSRPQEARRIQATLHALSIPVPEQAALVCMRESAMDQLLHGNDLSAFRLSGDQTGLALAKILEQRLAAPDASLPFEHAIDLGEIQARVSSQRLPAQAPVLEKALSCLRERHGDAALTIDAVARHAGISRRGLENLFQNQLQTSPWKMLRKIRMRAAWDALTTSTHDIETVALRSGYSSLHAFSAAFKETCGWTPGACRRGLPAMPSTLQ